MNKPKRHLTVRFSCERVQRPVRAGRRLVPKPPHGLSQQLKKSAAPKIEPNQA